MADAAGQDGITLRDLLRALMDEGFTPQEAVELVVAGDLIPPLPEGED